MTTRMLAFDLETTARDPLEARIVTAYLGIVEDAGSVSTEVDLLADPGVEIPEETTAIHGVSTTHARENGRPIKDVLAQIRDIIRFECIENGLPLAGQNISYDCSCLQSELLRHGLEPLDWSQVNVLDSLVLDKQIDRYRRGPRKLIVMAEHYGIPISEDEAHNASFDAVAAARIIQKILAHPSLASKSPRQLHDLQVRWKAAQAASLEAYLRSPKNRNGAEPDAVVDRGWPLHSALMEGAAA